jgi:AcrR family transcriptional regulator
MTTIDKSPWANSDRKRGNKFSGKREAVLAAAATLMGRNGYSGTSLVELAEILNVTKPTLYHYVGSKEELFSEIVARSQRNTIDFIQAVVDEETTAYEKLRKILLGYIEIVNSDFGTCVIFSNSPELGTKTRLQIRARAREANELIHRVLEQGRKDGTLRVADAGVALHTIFGALNWSPNWFKPNGRLPLREIAEQQVDLLLNGVRGDAQTQSPKRARRPRRSP